MDIILSITAISLLVASSTGTAGILGMIPFVLIILTLTLLSLFRERWAYITSVTLMAVIFILWPKTLILLPFLSYTAVLESSFFILIPVFLTVLTLFRGDYITTAASVVAGLLGWLCLDLERRRKENLSLKDSLRENEILNLKIRKEEESNSISRTEIALLNERNSISRRLHDSIGHTISSSLLQVEAMKTVADERMTGMLDRMSDNLSKGMDEIRMTLHDLHSSSFDLSAQIESVLKEYRSSYVVDFQYQMSEDVPQDLKRSILSIVKEAMNNVRKHSDADRVTVIIRELPGHYTVSIKDNGSEKVRPGKEALRRGIGLQGFKDTAEYYRGYVNCDFDNGFIIHMTIPKEKR